MSSPVEKDLTVRVQLQKGLQKYLDRSDITEIAVNRPGFVWVEESSGWRCYEDKNSPTITLPSSETSALFTEERIKRSTPLIRCSPWNSRTVNVPSS